MKWKLILTMFALVWALAACGGDVVGIDLVEVAPAYDPTESTQILAAQLLLNFIGFIFHERTK